MLRFIRSIKPVCKNSGHSVLADYEYEYVLCFKCSDVYGLFGGES